MANEYAPYGLADKKDLFAYSFNKRRAIFFGCFVPGGWFSAAPDDTAVNRAIRTNNPGALNVRPWQTRVPGFIGTTKPDSSGNITSIYQTPEHGVAAWFYLISARYGFSKVGKFDIRSLAARYAGAGRWDRATEVYIRGWEEFSRGMLRGESIVHLNSDEEMLSLGQAMFCHEVGDLSPLRSDQIVEGMIRGRRMQNI